MDSGAMDIDMVDSASGDEQHNYPAWTLASNIHKSCFGILQEIAQLESYYATNSTQLDPQINLGTFKHDLTSEKQRMEKLGETDPTYESHAVKLQATNQIFDEALWSVAKTCSDITAINQFFVITPGSVEKVKIKIDIIADSGREWIKVSTSTEKRIMWDIIKAGYHASEGLDDDDDEDDDDIGNGDTDTPSQMAELPLYNQMKELMEYGQSTNLRCPKIRLVMTRVLESQASKQTIRLFNEIRKLGVIVDTMDNILTLHISDAIPRMVPLKATGVMFSDTLVIDCTLLVSLCSDITGGDVEPQNWHTRNVSQQIQEELKYPFLCTKIFPIIGSKKLVCTRVAYNKLMEVLAPIGTATEKRRAGLLFPQVENEFSHMTPQERASELQKLSKYTPSHTTLPMNLLIEIIDVDISSIKTHLPPMAQTVVSELTETVSATTLETLLYSWATGFTALSSNNEALRKVRYRIKKYRGADTSIVGPEVWIFAPARNLVGDYYVVDRSLIPDSWKGRLTHKERKKAEREAGRSDEMLLSDVA